MIVLGLDTSAAHCAVALFQEGRALTRRADLMNKGQAENLFPIIHAVMEQDGVTWDEIGAIGVGIGPGNFTGIRISVAAARGLALGLGVPAIGVSSFDVATDGRAVPSAIPGPRGYAYLKLPGEEPRLVSQDLCDQIAGVVHLPSGADHAEVIARRAWLAWQDPERDTAQRPAPLYIKAADAAPPRDAPPRIIVA